MKTLLLIASACLSLMITEVNGSVVINLDALDLRSGPDGSSPLAPTYTLVLLVVDTAANGLATSGLHYGSSLALGSSINDDLIVARFDCSVGGPGYVSANTEFTGTQGKPLGIMWFPTLTLADTMYIGSLENTVKFGAYTGGSSPNHGDSWAIPIDTGAISLVLATTSSQPGALDPNSSGYAIYPIPEPSACGLVGLGLLGILGMMRRRQKPSR